MSKDTAVCLSLVLTFVVGFVVLMLSLPWLQTLGPQPWTDTRAPLVPSYAPARPSGQAIAETCARRANVDMNGLITRAQVQEMEQCAEQMMAAILR